MLRRSSIPTCRLALIAVVGVRRRASRPPLCRPAPPSLPALASSDAAVLAWLATAGAVGITAEQTRAGSVASSPLVALAGGAALALAGFLPPACALYDGVWSLAVPLAACLALIGAPHGGSGKGGGSAAAAVAPAFALACAATVAATFAAWRLTGAALGLDHGWKLAGALAATFTGGSANFAAVAASLTIPPTLVSSALAVDGLAMGVYFLGLALVPAGGVESARGGDRAALEPPSTPPTPASLLACTAAASACVAAGTAAAAAAGAPAGGLAAAALLASALAAAPRPPTVFAGAGALAGAVMHVFFATVGAAAGSAAALAGAGAAARFVSVQLAAQAALTFGVGRLLRIPTPSLIVAANAAVGGPATAAAFAAARGWPSLVRPGLLAGCAGYAGGTALGVAVAGALRGVAAG